MSAKFIPTLKHTMLAKTAVEICHDPEIRCLINKMDFLLDRFSGECKWKDLMDKAAKKVCKLPLPPLLRRSVLAVIKPVALEISRWKSDHLNLLGKDFKFEKCRFYWKEEGIIDRERTAEKLIQDKNVLKMNRFFLACLYCSEKEVKMIFNSMTPKEESLVQGQRFNFCANFWNCCVPSEGRPNWSELGRKIGNELYQSTINNYQRDPLFLRNFYHKLNPEEKERCVSYTAKNTFKEHDNFRFIISLLDENQRLSHFKEDPARLLRFFLDWPHQSLFSEASEQMWSYLRDTDFRYILHFIIYNRIVADWYDFDYIDLLKDFWRRSPEHLKEYIKKDPLYEPVRIVIDHDFPQLLPKEKLIEYSLHIEPPNDKKWLLQYGDFFYTSQSM